MALAYKTGHDVPDLERQIGRSMKKNQKSQLEIAFERVGFQSIAEKHDVSAEKAQAVKDAMASILSGEPDWVARSYLQEAGYDVEISKALIRKIKSGVDF